MTIIKNMTIKKVVIRKKNKVSIKKSKPKPKAESESEPKIEPNIDKKIKKTVIIKNGAKIRNISSISNNQSMEWMWFGGIYCLKGDDNKIYNNCSEVIGHWEEDDFHLE